jgi:hypothetical protein
LLNQLSVNMAGSGLPHGRPDPPRRPLVGTEYVTPVETRVKDGKFFLPLTFGNQAEP